MSSDLRSMNYHVFLVFLCAFRREVNLSMTSNTINPLKDYFIIEKVKKILLYLPLHIYIAHPQTSILTKYHLNSVVTTILFMNEMLGFFAEKNWKLSTSEIASNDQL